MSSDEMSSSDGVALSLETLTVYKNFSISFTFSSEYVSDKEWDEELITKILQYKFNAKNISIEEVEYYKVPDTE